MNKECIFGGVMNRTALCIKMLQILSVRNIVSIAELAERLETNPRNIPEFKKELEVAGYAINSTAGRYGGYSLDMGESLITPNLTSQEIAVLKNGVEYLSARNDFMEKTNFESAIGKIALSKQNDDNAQEYTIINRFPLAMSESELKNRYTAIEKCVGCKQKIKIEYLSLNGTFKERIIHPYKVFMYNNAWFVIAFDENRNEVLYFKINRIEKFKVLSDFFRVPYSFNERDYLDEFGMKQNGEWHEIKLKLSNQYAVLVKERIYGKDQTVEEIDEKTTILTCKMQNKAEILKFVMGYGSNCKVLEPDWLKEMVIKECERMLGE